MAPRLGEHNQEVLQGLLGVSDEEMERLEEEMVIGTEPVMSMSLDIARQLVRQPVDTFKRMGALQDVEPDYLEQLGLGEE